MILDSSVGLKWLVLEEDSDSAAALVGNAELFVPTFFHAEIANALWKKWRRGEIVLAEIAAHFVLLPELVITLDETEVMPRALEIAGALDHPVYDCIYLALAESRKDIVLTADLRFKAKVAATPYAALVEELADG